jgi:hypothetical protein
MSPGDMSHGDKGVYMKGKMFLVGLALAAVLIVPVVGAQDEEAEGIGLEVGVEFGLGDVADKAVFSMAPQVTYENSFLGGALDVFAEGIYAFAFEDPVGQGASLEEELGYNLSLGPSTLSFIVNNINEFITAPKVDRDAANSANGLLTPSLKFTQALGFGDLYGQVGLPVEYAFFEKDDEGKNLDTGLGTDLTAGWVSTFGFGAELTAHLAFKPESGYAGLDLILSYETGNIYAEVEIDTGKDFKDIVIIPEFDYSFKAFTLWVKAELGNINASEDDYGFKPDVSFAPAIGVKYSF